MYIKPKCWCNISVAFVHRGAKPMANIDRGVNTLTSRKFTLLSLLFLPPREKTPLPTSMGGAMAGYRPTPLDPPLD